MVMNDVVVFEPIEKTCRPTTTLQIALKSSESVESIPHPQDLE